MTAKLASLGGGFMSQNIQDAIRANIETFGLAGFLQEKVHKLVSMNLS